MEGNWSAFNSIKLKRNHWNGGCRVVFCGGVCSLFTIKPRIHSVPLCLIEIKRTPPLSLETVGKKGKGPNLTNKRQVNNACFCLV